MNKTVKWITGFFWLCANCTFSYALNKAFSSWNTCVITSAKSERFLWHHITAIWCPLAASRSQSNNVANIIFNNKLATIFDSSIASSTISAVVRSPVSSFGSLMQIQNAFDDGVLIPSFGHAHRKQCRFWYHKIYSKCMASSNWRFERREKEQEMTEKKFENALKRNEKQIVYH